MPTGRPGDRAVSPNPNLRVALTSPRALLAAIMLFSGLWLLAGCSFEPPPAESYINQATARALTPSATATNPPPTPTVTTTPTQTATPEPTESPTATTAPTRTPQPTPTTDPQLANMGYCRSEFGPADGARFSARLVSIGAQRLDLVDQLTLTFTDTQGLLHGRAGCIDEVDWIERVGTASTDAPGETVLALDLEDWAHDDAWAQSALTETQVLTGTSFGRVSVAADQLASRGATIGVGLRRTVPFRVRLEDRPVRLVVEVAREARLEAREDPLGQAAGRVEPPEEPIFFLQNYDVWRLENGRARPLTTTAELETSLAIAPDGETVAVCRAPASAEPDALPYDVRASLWVMRASGGEERLLADVGGCADLQFAPSGKTVSFTANTAAAPPALLSVWTVPVVVGDPRPATPIGDEWDRFGAAWLPDSRLIYRARNGSGQTVLLVREDDGSEQEVSARLLTGSGYSGTGQFVVGSDMLAVEALRADGAGADLVLLRFDGTEVAVERRAFWNRPLAFHPDGLVYLSTECPSSTVQEYALLRRQPDGTVDELLEGRTLGGIGDTTALGQTLLLNRVTQPQPGIRGPKALASTESAGSLWAISGDGAARREVYRAPVPILDLRAAAP